MKVQVQIVIRLETIELCKLKEQKPFKPAKKFLSDSVEIKRGSTSSSMTEATQNIGSLRKMQN